MRYAAMAALAIALGTMVSTARLNGRADGTTDHQTSAGTLTAGYAHSLAILPDGSLWTWGDNKFGQPGNGTMEDRNRPVWIGTDTDWKAVANGEWHSVATKTDGTVWAWGQNEKGQLGGGTKADAGGSARTKPQQNNQEMETQ
jgi:alpha-tubulin suppressor-like RCC1 family protein